uniref:Uncharacterized protein n=1 Tax=viral metagenome TaxID=1070528 RepID=A0A6C0J6B9_9ZZZZ
MDDNNNKIIEHLELTTQELTLLKSLKKFYNNKKDFETLNTIINGQNYISRRTIEYFVTNYALYNKIYYNIEEKGIVNKFYVHTSYKDQLKAHKKKYFDPFGRGIRIPFFLDDMCIITTIGQLNFYRWFFSKKIYDYSLENYNIIQSSLLSCKKNIKKKKVAINMCNIKKNKLKYDYKPKINNTNNNGNIIVSFDI